MTQKAASVSSLRGQTAWRLVLLTSGRHIQPGLCADILVGTLCLCLLPSGYTRTGDGTGETKVRDLQLLSPLPERMAWSGSSGSSLL